MELAIGLFAAAMTIASFVAQVYKILKTRDTKGIATSMWLLSTCAFAVWIVYGVLLGQWPIIIPNAVCFVLAGFILALKLMRRATRDAIADKLTSAG